MRSYKDNKLPVRQIFDLKSGNRSGGFRALSVFGVLALVAGVFFVVHPGKNNPVSANGEPPEAFRRAFAARDAPQEEKAPDPAAVSAPSKAVPAALPTGQGPPAPRPDVQINEIMPGSALGGDDEFIELWNGSDFEADLTGWSIKKRSGSGAESVVVSRGRFSGITIPAWSYLLFANDGGYRGTTPSAVRWPRSATLAYKENALLLYDSEGAPVDEVAWKEIPRGGSAERGADGTFALQEAPSPGRGVRRSTSRL